VVEVDFGFRIVDFGICIISIDQLMKAANGFLKIFISVGRFYQLDIF